MSIVDDLRAVSGERTHLPEGFEIATEVRAAAMMWPLTDQRRIDMVCNHQVDRGGHAGRCGQVVLPVSRDGDLYEYTDEEREGLVLAHLMQRHGWTREVVGRG
jgi:hypothetical protein